MNYEIQYKRDEIEQLAKKHLRENAVVTIEDDYRKPYLPTEIYVNLDNEGKTTRSRGLMLSYLIQEKSLRFIIKFYSLNHTYNLRNLQRFIKSIDKIVEGIKNAD